MFTMCSISYCHGDGVGGGGGGGVGVAGYVGDVRVVDGWPKQPGEWGKGGGGQFL